VTPHYTHVCGCLAEIQSFLREEFALGIETTSLKLGILRMRGFPHKRGRWALFSWQGLVRQEVGKRFFFSESSLCFSFFWEVIIAGMFFFGQVVFIQSRGREWGRGGGGVVSLPGIGVGGGTLGTFPNPSWDGGEGWEGGPYAILRCMKEHFISSFFLSCVAKTQPNHCFVPNSFFSFLGGKYPI